MKFRFFNWLFIIDILVIVLILTVLFIPSSVVRIVLGLPFLLFFPGYTLVCALFPRKDEDDSFSDSYDMEDGGKKGMDGIERIALSFGMSIAISALIGLGLNYTPWGIRLEPILFSISGFIIIMSIVALARQDSYAGRPSLVRDYEFHMPGWEGGPFSKLLTLILAIAILGAVGTLVYTVAFPKVGEKFTEFYILGLNDKAQDYPAELIVTNNQVTQVNYGSGSATTDGSWSQVTLGIVNQEQQKTTYSVKVQIDGQPVNVRYMGNVGSSFEGLELQQAEKWEQQIEFAPPAILAVPPAGSTPVKLKVEFLLYKDGAAEVYQTLHIWISLRGG